MRWTFTLGRALAVSEVADLETVAGVKAWPTKVAAPANAGPTVRDALTALGVPFSIAFGDDYGRIKDAALALRQLREWVPAFLTAYQRRGIQRALTEWPNGSGMFVWSAGSGKTLAAIVWALASPARTVVVTKAAVKLQWAGEVERFTTVRPTVLDGETIREIDISSTFLIVSYEILPAWIGELERWARGFKLRPSVVYDESQKVQSHKRWEATVDTSEPENSTATVTVDVASFFDPVAEVMAMAPPPTATIPLPAPKVKFSLRDNIAAAAMRLSKIAGRRLCTTATPIRDRVRNLWAQLDLMHPWEWGNYWTWATRYCAATERIFGGMDDTGRSNEVELAARLAVVSHRVSHAEANRELPPKRRIVTYVTIQNQVKSGMVNEIRTAARQGVNALREALLMEAAARKRRRLTELVDMAVEAGEKVIVFTGRRKDCDILRETFETRFSGKAFVTGGHGGDSQQARHEAKEKYMATKTAAVLVGTTDAWSEGLNLHDTDLLLVALLPITPGQIIQLEGRVARLGQTRPVLINYLVAEGTIDERFSSILLSKIPAVEKVIGQDEIAGFAREMSGVDDQELINSLAEKILNSAKRVEVTS